MKVKELLSLPGFNEITLPDPEREIEGVYIGDLLSWVMKSLEEGSAWLTIMSNVNILAVAALKDGAVIILCEGVSLDENVKKTALEKGINVLSTEKTAYEAAVTLSPMI